MTIQGNKITIQKSDKDIFDFLSNLQNFEQLMPESIQKFEVQDDAFLFALKGMPEIKLALKNTSPFSNITLDAAGGKIDFDLVANIKKKDENSCEIQLVFNGHFNPMMTMMVKKPITNFINTLTENLAGRGV